MVQLPYSFLTTKFNLFSFAIDIKDGIHQISAYSEGMEELLCLFLGKQLRKN